MKSNSFLLNTNGLLRETLGMNF